MAANGYVAEVLAMQERLKAIVPEVKLRYPRWISTPDGDQGGDWCSDCSYYMWRHLRRRDPKRREDYFLDGGWVFGPFRPFNVVLKVSTVDSRSCLFFFCSHSSEDTESRWEPFTCAVSPLTNRPARKIGKMTCPMVRGGAGSR